MGTRIANLTPILCPDPDSDNFYGKRHWRWEAWISWRGELVCTVSLSDRGVHKTRKVAIKCALKMLKMLGVKPGNVCLKKTEQRTISSESAARRP